MDGKMYFFLFIQNLSHHETVKWLHAETIYLGAIAAALACALNIIYLSIIDG